MLRELGEQRDETESVIEVAKRIDKRRITFLDDRRKRVLRSFAEMVFSKFDFATTQEFFMFLQVSLDVSELLKQLVVLENFQVFNVIVSLVIALELLLRLAWVNALQNAKLTEVL